MAWRQSKPFGDNFPRRASSYSRHTVATRECYEALKVGARGYVLKGYVHKELLDAIRAVHAGQKRIPLEIAAVLADHATDDALTEREIHVLRLVAAGNSNKQIGGHLSIGEATVKSHLTNILSKLGANDRAHAVTIGLTRGIIELDPPKSRIAVSD